MDVEKILKHLENEAKNCYEYALECNSNSIQEHWFGQSQGFRKAISIIENEVK